MTLDQINYVLEINKTGSFSRAAENLFVTQSALSLAVQNLEKELGQPLFLRTNRGVLPTDFGKNFIRYISPVQLQLKQIDSLFFSGKRENTLTFVLVNDGFKVASEAFADLFHKYEYVDVYMKQIENYSDEAKSLVATGQADVGFVRIWDCYKKIEYQQLNARGLIYQQVAETGLVVGIGPKHPLYGKELKSISPEMLLDYPLIQHEYMDGSPWSNILEKIGIRSTRSIVVTASRAVVDDLLMKTDAYFISADTRDFYDKDDLMQMIPLETNVKAELGWIARKGQALSPLAQEYISLLEQRFIL